ncbi:CobW family GTP-binding protein [Fictibacillus iocasae]|uniref:CobW family GTP-binding protein n=1 Tax=Fictibacillus iocasae TaxID=2715437 RepID=A0ABW2NI16_9BACL
MVNEKLPVFILTGFLGSGKTTVLLHLLQKCKEEGLRPGIVLNELGSVNVETHFFENERLVEVLDGCICCSVKEELKNEIRFFLKEENRVDILFIEGTGVADPKEILDAFVSPELIKFFDVHSIISVIDASRYLEYNSLFSSSREIKQMLHSQITNSTLLLLNKTDAVSSVIKEKVLKKLEKQTEGKIEIIETQFGVADLKRVLSQRMIDGREENDGTDSPTHKNHLFRSVKITDFSYEMDKKSLEDKLSLISGHVIRAKGIITAKKERWHFQYASRSLSFQPYTGTAEDCIVLIGTKLPVTTIKEIFNVR